MWPTVQQPLLALRVWNETVDYRPEPDVLSSFFRRWAPARALIKVGLPLTGGGAWAGCGEPAGMIILLSQLRQIQSVRERTRCR